MRLPKKHGIGYLKENNMGYKSRGNWAPCYSMTDEEYNRIFRKKFFIALEKGNEIIIAPDIEKAIEIAKEKYGESYIGIYTEEEFENIK